MLENFPNLIYFLGKIFHKFPYFQGNILSMVLLHDISGKIPMHFIKTFVRALKETSQLFIGNFSTTANLSMSIFNSVQYSI
jgi:hypothetical protein